MLPSDNNQKFGMAVTYDCNMHSQCEYCYSKCFADMYSEMAPEWAQQYLTWIAELGGRWLIKILGGEPTVHSAFHKLLHYIDGVEDAGELDVRVYTNGTANDSAIDAIMRSDLVKGVVVHYDEKYTEAIPDLVTRVQSLCMALAGNGKQIDFRYNTSDPNFDFGPLWDLAREFGGNIIYSFTAPSLGVKRIVPLESYKQFVPRLQHAARKAERLNVKLQSSRPFPLCCLPDNGRKELMSSIGINTVCKPYPTINPDGTVIVCSPVFIWRSQPIQDRDSFYKAMEEAADKASRLQWQQPRWEACKSCKAWRSRECQGGCLAYCNPVTVGE